MKEIKLLTTLLSAIAICSALILLAFYLHNELTLFGQIYCFILAASACWVHVSLMTRMIDEMKS